MDEAEKRTSRFSHKSGIDEDIGKETWRQSQSVVDLIQNHLDASTTVYERALLGALGNIPYQPDNRDQQLILKHADRIKHSSAEQAIVHYDNLCTVLDSAPDLEVLIGRLELISLPLPRVRLLMSNGATKQLVDYDDVRALSEEWAIVGFRVDDEGLGFDDNLLPVLGMSTKKAQTARRGGLGEGLKVSVAHLVRAGATVRLASRNMDEFWIARPKVVEGEIEFNGIQKKGESPEVTGSLTDVDFSTSHIDPTFQAEVVKVLDPRIGEGLGKYILEIRGTEFFPLINESCCLNKMGVEGGRIYVKGLLVEEHPNLLFSYNLGDKWAISGRDRKKAKSELVEELIATTLAGSDILADIEKVLRADKAGSPHREVHILKRLRSGMLSHPEIWRQAVTNVYDFHHGTCLFSTDMSTEMIRLAQEHGYRLVMVSSTNFYQSLYPDPPPPITYDQLLNQISRPRIHETDSFLHVELTRYTQAFERIMKNLFADSESRVWLTSVYRLGNLRFVKDTSLNQSGQSPFRYDLANDVMIVRQDINELDFSILADFYIECIKVICRRNVHDTQTQMILTLLTANVTLARNPSVLEALDDFPAIDTSAIHWRPSYGREQKPLDDELIHCYELADQLNNPDITMEEVERVLDELRTLINDSSQSQFSNPIHTQQLDSIIRDRNIGRGYLFDGELYTVEKGLKLQKYLSSEYIQTSGDTFTLGKLSKRIYLPISLPEGGTRQLVITEMGEEYRLVLRRSGKEITFQFINRDPMYSRWHMRSNYLYIYPDREIEYLDEQEITITIRETPIEQKQQLEEKNQGKEYIEANFTIDYGGDVWIDPKRILIDTLQNHMDAQKNQFPQILFTIAGPHGEISRVSSDEIVAYDEMWKVIGVQITDNGMGYPTPYLTQIGTSTKGEDDSGRFGEGLKLLSASALRQGIHVELRSRNWIARPAVHTQTIFDYEAGAEKTFDLMGYDMSWSTTSSVGSQTTFSLFPLGDEVTSLTREQQETLAHATSRSPDTDTTWNAWVSILDPRNVNEFGEKGINAYVLDSQSPEVMHTGGPLSILPNRPGRIYERGLLVLKKEAESEKERFIFGYNIAGKIINTRERNGYDEHLLNQFLNEYYSTMADPRIMKMILEATKKFPQKYFREYEFIGSTFMNSNEAVKSMWRAAFYEVYGDSAILSLRGTEWDETAIRAVANEVHLENDNLVFLPRNLIYFFHYIGVTTSADFIKQLENEVIVVSPQELDHINRFVNQVNTHIGNTMDFLLSKPDARKYLERVVPISVLEARLSEMRQMTGNSVIVKHASYSVAGEFRMVDNKPVILLNQKLFSDRKKLYATYLHEMLHFLSDRGDYVQDFQRVFMALVLGAYWNQESGGVKEVS